MPIFYSIFVCLLGLLIHFSSFFNKKTRKWILVRKNWLFELQQKLSKKDAICWIHCSSAGEFEQANPLIERIRKLKPKLRIAVSFFSPSGFEMYKGSGLADLFFYFPLDTKRNAQQLIETLKPDFVIFIRNEIWLNTLTELRNRNIPTYLVNANSEKKRNSFYQYYLNIANPLFTKIFDTKTWGNTKSERVIEIKDEIYNDKILEDFCKDSPVIILGSSWRTEEKFAAVFLKKNKIANLKFIIAPHEFDNNKQDDLEKLFGEKIISYTEYQKKSPKQHILFLNKKGILKHIYRYADIAFIGGGFEKTVHNVSEAAVYGIPALFGPNYGKFEEINELVSLQIAFPINNYMEFENGLLSLINDVKLRETIQQKATDYFTRNQQTSQEIISEILK